MSLSPSLERELGTDGAGVTWGGAYTLVDFIDNPPELTWPLSNVTYERMRRDAKVRETLLAVTLPVRGARWSLDPNGARDEVVASCSRNVGLPVRGQELDRSGRLRDRFSWSEHLRLALLMLVFGHMPFEQVYRIDPTGPGGALQANLRKLAPRMPSTLSRIDVAEDGGLVGIKQLLGRQSDGGTPPLIPVDRLVWYANDREGGAWQGQSALRAAYRPWRLKDEALRTWAMSLRRNGIGQPIYHGAQGESQPSLDQGRELARQARAGEVSGAAVPYGAGLTFEGVRGSLPDHQAFIQACDEQIAATMLAEFLKLGSSRSGNRALGETFVDFFTLSLQSLAESICDTATAHIVEDLVDLNFGPDEQAPRVVVDGVGTDHRLTPDQLANLMTSGVLVNDPVLEDYVRTELYHLPAKDPNAPPEPAPPVPKPLITTAASRGRAVKAQRDPNEIEATASVDFEALDEAWQEQLDALLTSWKTERTHQLQFVLEQIRAALDAGDLGALADVVPQTGQGAALLEQAMLSLADTAALEAQGEASRQGVTVDLPTIDSGPLQVRAQLVDELLARSLTDAVVRQAMLRWVDGVSTQDVLDEIITYVDGLSDSYLTDQLGGALTAAQNHARLAVMRTGPVQNVYASELLDGATCPPCGDIDGTRYATVTAAEADYPTGGYKDCLGGPRCRGTLVAIYQSESAPSVA